MTHIFFTFCPETEQWSYEKVASDANFWPLVDKFSTTAKESSGKLNYYCYIVSDQEWHIFNHYHSNPFHEKADKEWYGIPHNEVPTVLRTAMLLGVI